MMHHPDHIICFVPNLEEAYDFFEETWGVRPQFGGQHPNRGSHNALLSLGETCYLEIIAPDPTQPTPAEPRSFGMDQLSKPKLVTWAVTSTAIDRSVQYAKDHGYDPGKVYDGARARGDGSMMHWKLTRRPEAVLGTNPLGDWLVPFLIDWGQTTHPAQNNPKGCTLVEVKAFHPDPVRVQKLMNAMQVVCAISYGETPQLTAVIQTPNGLVELR